MKLSKFFYFEPKIFMSFVYNVIDKQMREIDNKSDSVIQLHI